MTMTMAEAEALLRSGRMLIGGEWVAAGSGEFVHINPSTGCPHPSVVVTGAPEADAAVAAARAASSVWRGMPVDACRDAMLRQAGLIHRHADELSAFTTVDNSAPPRSARGGVMGAVDYFTYFAGWIDKIGGDVIPVWPAPALDYSLMEPYGVVGVIIPWNVPMHNVGQVFGAAIAAGNTVVLKAPGVAPFAVLRFGELVVEAGLPAGVINILPGGAACGSAMVDHQGIDKLHYIGGGAVAKKIMVSAAQTLKPLTFELGGKSANIIFAESDLRNAVGHVGFMGVALSGQGCLLPTRVLTEESIYDQVVPMIADLVRSMKVGDPFAEGTVLGPVITARACERILGVVEKAKAEGRGSCLQAASARVVSYLTVSSWRRRCSGTSTTPAAWPRRRRSARCCRSCASGTRYMRSSWPTTLTSAWRPTCTQTTFVGPTASRLRSRAAR
jgi:acyl-CoA reductase-like NAD-dependent aldehyde dehydrogenase